MKGGTRRHKPARAGLADALFSKVQQRVPGVLFANPGRSFFAKEIMGLAHSGTGRVQRQLVRLESSGLVCVTRMGKQKHWQANARSPLFEELRGLALKTFGLMDILRAALDPIASDIRAAFGYRSIARVKDTAESDIDVLVISDHLAHADRFSVLETASARSPRRSAHRRNCKSASSLGIRSWCASSSSRSCG